MLNSEGAVWACPIAKPAELRILFAAAARFLKAFSAVTAVDAAVKLACVLAAANWAWDVSGAAKLAAELAAVLAAACWNCVLNGAVKVDAVLISACWN